MFTEDSQLPGNCVASGTLDLITIDSSTNQIRESLADVLAFTHNSFGDAEKADAICAHEFKVNVFPGAGTENAEVAGNSLYGTTDSLNVDLSLSTSTLKEVAAKTNTRLSRWSPSARGTRWEERLKSFRVDVAEWRMSQPNYSILMVRLLRF